MKEGGMSCSERLHIISFIHNNYTVDTNTKKVGGSEMLPLMG
jgi:hypothetical protein